MTPSTQRGFDEKMLAFCKKQIEEAEVRAKARTFWEKVIAFFGYDEPRETAHYYRCRAIEHMDNLLNNE